MFGSCTRGNEPTLIGDKFGRSHFIRRFLQIPAIVLASLGILECKIVQTRNNFIIC